MSQVFSNNLEGPLYSASIWLEGETIGEHGGCGKSTKAKLLSAIGEDVALEVVVSRGGADELISRNNCKWYGKYIYIYN